MSGGRYFWLSHRAAVVGLFIAVLIGGGVVALMTPFGAAEAVSGRIVAFGMSEGKSGSRGVTVVHVDSRTVDVRTGGAHDCRVGDRIALIRRRSLLGAAYQVELRPDPCG